MIVVEIQQSVARYENGVWTSSDRKLARRLHEATSLVKAVLHPRYAPDRDGAMVNVVLDFIGEGKIISNDFDPTFDSTVIY